MQRRGRSDNLAPSHRTCAVRMRYVKAISSYLYPRIRTEHTSCCRKQTRTHKDYLRIQIHTGPDLFNTDNCHTSMKKHESFKHSCKKKHIFRVYLKSFAKAFRYSFLLFEVLNFPKFKQIRTPASQRQVESGSFISGNRVLTELAAKFMVRFLS